jgi:hypothetical protein
VNPSKKGPKIVQVMRGVLISCTWSILQKIERERLRNGSCGEEQGEASKAKRVALFVEEKENLSSDLIPLPHTNGASSGPLLSRTKIPGRLFEFSKIGS